MEEQKQRENVLQLVSFSVGEEKFAIDISDVHEINRFEEINKIPDLPDHVMGVIDLRGIVIPVIKLSDKLDMAGRNITKDTRIIIIELKKEKIGILVDSVSEVLRVLGHNLERPPPIIQNVNSKYIKGIIRDNNKLIVVLDLPLLFKDYDLDLESKISDSSEVKSVITQEIISQDTLGRIAEATKAMSEGDFHRVIGDELYGQIGEIAKYINTTIKKLQTVEPAVSQASDKIPQASAQLSEITRATEEATHNIMSQVEHVLDSQDLILHHLDSLEKEGDINRSVNEIKQIVTENKEALLNIITGLSFQDLTGQKLEAIIGLIEEVEKRMLHLIVTFGLKSKEGIRDDNTLKEFSSSSVIKQDLVDCILKEFGFE